MDIKNNFYLRDKVQKLKYYKVNKQFSSVNSECGKIDSILDYDHFKDFVVHNIKNKSSKTYFMQHEFGFDGLFYGHRNAFFEYAGIESEEQRYIFPYFEAGADLRVQVKDDVIGDYNYSYLFQSPYKNKIIRMAKPYAPIYNVGPYILYAHHVYPLEQMKQIKKEYGKTVLLFPGHSFEGTEVEYNKKSFVEQIIGEFSDSYDTILVSVYWNDVDDPIYDVFRKAGARLVSAGFRGDQNFIHRLRTLIEISDLVVSNLVGSYVGFSQALGKPLYMMSDRAKYTGDEYNLSGKSKDNYQNTINDIFWAFSSMNPNEEQIRKQHELYEYFWGGSHFLTKKQAKSIIELQTILLKECHGNSMQFMDNVKKILEGKSNIIISDDQMETLYQAIYVNK